MKQNEQADWSTIAIYLRSKTSGGNKQKRRMLQGIWDVLPMHKWLHDHGWETDGGCQCGEGHDDLTRRKDCWLREEQWRELDTALGGRVKETEAGLRGVVGEALLGTRGNVGGVTNLVNGQPVNQKHFRVAPGQGEV